MTIRTGAAVAALVLAGLLGTAGCARHPGAGSKTTAAVDLPTPPGARLHKCGVVLDTGPAGAWDAGMVESPAVWYDAARGRYGMVYAGYGLRTPGTRGYDAVTHPQVGLAWSDDLFHWQRDAANPVFGPSGVPGTPDAAGASGPFVWHEDGTYYLFYIGVTEAGYEGGRKTLNLATSTDLRSWTRYAGNPVIAPAGDGWRRDAIWHPNVVKVADTYYLFFNASGGVDGADEERIGYATSTDLFHWDVADADAPVLSGSGVPGAWDAAGRTGDPSLYRVGDTWYMAYYSWDRVRAQDGLAWTTAEAFPLDWQPYAHNPVLRTGPPGTFDAAHAHKPFIFRTDDRHFHFYTAVDTAQARTIALAAWPAPCS